MPPTPDRRHLLPLRRVECLTVLLLAAIAVAVLLPRCTKPASREAAVAGEKPAHAHPPASDPTPGGAPGRSAE